MSKQVIRLFFLLVSFVAPLKIRSQILPAEGASLNYRIIGFSFPAEKKINSCTLEIAAGNWNTADSFRKHIIKTMKGSSNRLVAEVPDFGKPYTWRYMVSDSPAHAEQKTSILHHFSTGIFPGNGLGNPIHVRIVKRAEKHKDAYVFIDEAKTLYDMNGRPVWYLPHTEFDNKALRDLKITMHGTITYEIDEYGAYEVNYEGAILWKAPNNGAVSRDSVEHYHHEFTRLNNGHYMALAQDFQYFKKPTLTDTGLIIVPKDKIKPDEEGNAYEREPMGTLIEYDQKGNVVWSWKSSDHFNGSTLFYRKMNTGGMQLAAHENSFFFDEKTKAVYLSCRNQGRIIKIKYPEGNILAVYGGDQNYPGPAGMGNGFFCGQHSCRISRDSYLYLFNNNVCNAGAAPTVVMLQEPHSVKDTLQKVWEYHCKVQNKTAYAFASGGNVIELPDRSVFISLGYPDSKLFIVNRDKKILWSAVAEEWDPTQKIWEPTILYRASIITDRAQLEQLIWGGEKADQ
jgi:hypothetical protein